MSAAMMVIINLHIVPCLGLLLWSLLCLFYSEYQFFTETPLIHFPENKRICYYTVHRGRNYILSSIKKKIGKRAFVA